MTNGLKRYDVHLWDEKNQFLSDTLLSTDSKEEALYLARELELMCKSELILHKAFYGDKKNPYAWSEVYDNETEDNVYECGRTKEE